MSNMKKEQLRLYAVTDRTWLGNETLYEQVEKALRGGATLVQLREKDLPEADVQKEAEELLELCHRYGVLLILDDDVELAAKVGADGVHIGQSDMELAHARAILGPDKIIGVTAKTVEQATAGRNLSQRTDSGCSDRRNHSRKCIAIKRQRHGRDCSSQWHFRLQGYRGRHPASWRTCRTDHIKDTKEE